MASDSEDLLLGLRTSELENRFVKNLEKNSVLKILCIFFTELCFLFSFSQARLNEIITSGTKAVHSSSLPEKQWMVDGAGLPPNASELLPKLVKQVLISCINDYGHLVILHVSSWSSMFFQLC